MKKDELKQAFGGLEPTEELTKEVWTRVEKNMETVKKSCLLYTSRCV